jgi:A nuclease family of the HNH/ENDO VII superfamily with conserved AHH
MKVRVASLLIAAFTVLCLNSSPAAADCPWYDPFCWFTDPYPPDTGASEAETARIDLQQAYDTLTADYDYDPWSVPDSEWYTLPTTDSNLVVIKWTPDIHDAGAQHPGIIKISYKLPHRNHLERGSLVHRTQAEATIPRLAVPAAAFALSPPAQAAIGACAAAPACWVPLAIAGTGAVVYIGGQWVIDSLDLFSSHAQSTATSNPYPASFLVRLPDFNNLDPCSIDPPLCGGAGSSSTNHTSELNVSDRVARGNLSNVMSTPAGQRAHHLIPWQWRGHPVVQQAARGGFNINGRGNGLNVSTGQQPASHYHYNRRVGEALAQFKARYPTGVSDRQAADWLYRFAQQLRTDILANPNAVLR